jgi:hypothetical protein
MKLNTLWNQIKLQISLKLPKLEVFKIKNNIMKARYYKMWTNESIRSSLDHVQWDQLKIHLKHSAKKNKIKKIVEMIVPLFSNQ